jgi:NCS2 family nucleobase:cation symporter-2
VRTLSRVRFNNANVLVVAISLGIGLLPTVSPDLYTQFPTWFQIIFNSGISAGAITAIVLNLVFNSRAVQRSRGTDEDEFSAHDAVRAAAIDTTMPVPDSGATLESDPTGREKG